jgi:hypothetical protein
MIIAPVHIPPTMDDPGLFGKSSTQVICSAYEPENYCVAWTTWSSLVPHIIFKAERWQALTDLGNGKTKYETFEVFSGPVAYLVKLFVGRNLKISVQAMADEMKKRAEES